MSDTTKPKEEKKETPAQKPKEKEAELSDEDKELKDKMDLWIEKVIHGETTDIRLDFLKQLKEEVKASTSSMTSIPKPFKFVKPHYNDLVSYYNGLSAHQLKTELANFISVISMSMADPYNGESLFYLQKGNPEELLLWGHEYLQQQCADIGAEYEKRLVDKSSFEDLLDVCNKIVPYFVNNNSEMEAVDLLLEIDQQDQLPDLVLKDNYKKVYDYLVASSPFAPDNDDYLKVLQVAFNITMKHQDFSNALRVAIKLDDEERIKEAFNACKDPLIQKQLAFALGRQRLVITQEDEELTNIMSNSLLSEYYIKLAEDMSVQKPKKPEEVIKAHQEDSRNTEKIDSSLLNLASTYINAFVNVGTGQDALMQKKDEPWIRNVKDEGILAATASLGMVYLWDINGCSSEISDYLELKDGWAKAGACIGIGLANSGVWSDVDPAKALLEESLESTTQSVKMGAVIGLGLAYAGTARDDFLESISPILDDEKSSIETAVFSSLSQSLIHVGRCNENVVNSIQTILMTKSEPQLNESIAKMFGVALGLCYMGKQELCEPAMETLKTIEHPIARYCEVVTEACAYIGSGNVLKVQGFLQKCTEHKDEKESQPQAASVISIAMLAISEGVGNEMAIRTMHHIIQYCELSVKRAVPIALALLSISNPQIVITDLLSKFAHDEDAEMSRRSIFALGLIAAGTNNSRVAGILRGLSAYYERDHKHIFLIRIAQGLLHAGKGLVTLNPFYSDKLLYSKVSMAGLVIVAHAMLDTENILTGKYHYFIYYQVCSLYPRMLFTLNEQLENIPVSVRVGQAVDTVGQAGNPRQITGFQTHTSPVLISVGERAELGNDDYLTTSDVVMENFVILKKNPELKDNKVEKNVKKNSVSLYL